MGSTDTDADTDTDRQAQTDTDRHRQTQTDTDRHTASTKVLTLFCLSHTMATDVHATQHATTHYTCNGMLDCIASHSPSGSVLRTLPD